MTINNTSFADHIKEQFVAARSVGRRMPAISEVNLFAIDCYTVNNTSFAEMKTWVDQAVETGSLLVFLFHGAGGGSLLNVSGTTHRELLEYLKAQEKDPMDRADARRGSIRQKHRE